MSDKAKERLFFITIVVLSLLPLSSLLHPGMFVAHDSEAHVVRVASFYQSLTEGNIFPRWSQSLNAGYGHPILMFLYPMSSYLSALFHFLGWNFAESIKLVLAIGYMGSGILMYLWLKRHVSSPAAVIGTAVFQLAPYRFVNLYVRNALGENTAFLFMPLVLLAFHELIKKPSLIKTVLASLSLAGLILAHNAVSLMFLPFLLVYCVILVRSSPSQPHATSYTLLASLLGFGLASFFWLPAMLEAKYTLRDIVMQGDTFAIHFPSLKQLIIPSWGYDNSIPGDKDDLSFQIGIIQWLSFIASIFFCTKKQDKRTTIVSHLSCLSLITFIASTALLLEISLPLWKILPLIKKFQFPWRFLTLPVFTSGTLAAISLDTSLKHKTIKKWPQSFLTGGIIIALVLLTFSYWHPVSWNFPPEEKLLAEYLGTSDTGESVPRWAVRFQEKRADNILGMVEGEDFESTIHTRISELHEHTITTVMPTKVSENTLYFPGWKVYIDGQEALISYEDISWRGVIIYTVPQGTHNVRVVFEETKVRKISNIITIISLGIIGILCLKSMHFRSSS